MTVVVDASLALKWVLQEEHTEEALSLWDIWQAAAEVVIAPPIFRSEVTNALHQYVRRGHVTRKDGSEALESLLSLVAVREPPELYQRALTLAGELVLGATYDTLYLALAESAACEMWTADMRFVRSAQPRFPQLRGVTERP